MITAHEVYEAEFRRAAIGVVGYDEVSVDDFLDRAIATLSAIERGEALTQNAVTSDEVVNVEFPERSSAVHGGYDLDDVDDLLDEVAKRLFAFEQGSAATPGRQSDEGSLGSNDDAAPVPELSDDEPIDAERDARDSGGVADAAALAVAAGAPSIAESGAEDVRDAGDARDVEDVRDAADAQDAADGRATEARVTDVLVSDAAAPDVRAADAPVSEGRPADVHAGGVQADVHAGEGSATGVNRVGDEPLPERAPNAVAPVDAPIHAVGSDPDDESIGDAQLDGEPAAMNVPVVTDEKMTPSAPADHGQHEHEHEQQVDVENAPESVRNTVAQAVPESAASVIVDDVAQAPRRTMGESWGDGVGAEMPLPGVAGHAGEDAPMGEMVVTEPVSAPEAATTPVRERTHLEGDVTSGPIAQSDWAPSEAPADGPQFVSYPATDHRVPLPRSEVRRFMSEDDLEAESHYHPEYSAYVTPDDASDEARADARGADVAGALETPTVSLPDLDPLESTPTPTPERAFASESQYPAGAAPFESFEEKTMSHEPTPADGFPAAPGHVAPANEELAGERPLRDPATVGNPPPAVAAELARQAASRDAERRDAQGAEAPNVTEPLRLDHDATDIGRPEPIDAPESLDRMTEVESIDAPAALPERDDTSRKGILRRIFKG